MVALIKGVAKARYVILWRRILFFFESAAFMRLYGAYFYTSTHLKATRAEQF